MRQRAVFLFGFALCLVGALAVASFATPALNALTRPALLIAACVWLTYVVVATALPLRQADSH